MQPREIRRMGGRGGGFIQSKELHQVPDDMEKYKASLVAQKIKSIYQEILS